MYNQTSTLQPKNLIKTTIVIHLALLMGQVLFGALVFAITPNPVFNFEPGNDVFLYVLIVLAGIGALLGSFLFKQQLANAAGKTNVKDKLGVYQTAFIIRAAFSEGASMFGIVCTLITGNLFYLAIVGINVLYFIWIRPTRNKIEEALNLDYNEKAAIDG
jgi:F0F1-type ATP synthase membrane subunit c/vacuolar-type H+-ATPase subunit K